MRKIFVVLLYFQQKSFFLALIKNFFSIHSIQYNQVGSDFRYKQKRQDFHNISIEKLTFDYTIKFAKKISLNPKNLYMYMYDPFQFFFFYGNFVRFFTMKCLYVDLVIIPYNVIWAPHSIIKIWIQFSPTVTTKKKIFFISSINSL